VAVSAMSYMKSQDLPELTIQFFCAVRSAKSHSKR
jgi:hypothetical protein